MNTGRAEIAHTQDLMTNIDIDSSVGLARLSRWIFLQAITTVIGQFADIASQYAGWRITTLAADYDTLIAFIIELTPAIIFAITDYADYYWRLSRQRYESLLIDYFLIDIAISIADTELIGRLH